MALHGDSLAPDSTSMPTTVFSAGVLKTADETTIRASAVTVEDPHPWRDGSGPS